MSKVYEFYNPFVKKNNSNSTVDIQQSQNFQDSKTFNYQSVNMQNYDFKPRFAPHHCDFGCNHDCGHNKKDDCKHDKKDKECCDKHDCRTDFPFCEPSCFPVFPCFPSLNCSPCPPNCWCGFPINCNDNNFKFGVFYFNCQMPPYNCFDQQKQFMFFVNKK